MKKKREQVEQKDSIVIGQVHVHGFSLLYMTRWDLNTDWLTGWLAGWLTGTDSTVDTPKWLHWSGGTGLENRDEYDTETSRAAKLQRLGSCCIASGDPYACMCSASVLAFLHGPWCWKTEDAKWSSCCALWFHLPKLLLIIRELIQIIKPSTKWKKISDYY